MAASIKVLFVCTGNICRSPTAEAVFRSLLHEARLHDRVAADSAGTHGFHAGHPPDPRSVQAAARRGYDLSTLRARLVGPADFADSQYLLAMDRENLDSLWRMCPPKYRDKPRLLLDFSSHRRGEEIPDPYFGGALGFELVLDLVEDATRGLLAEVKKKLGD